MKQIFFLFHILIITNINAQNLNTLFEANNREIYKTLETEITIRKAKNLAYISGLSKNNVSSIDDYNNDKNKSYHYTHLNDNLLKENKDSYNKIIDAPKSKEISKYLGGYLALSGELGMGYIDATQIIKEINSKASMSDKFTMSAAYSVKLGYLHILQYECKRMATSYTVRVPNGTYGFSFQMPGYGTVYSAGENSDKVPVKIRTVDHVIKLNSLALKSTYNPNEINALFLVYGKSNYFGSNHKFNIYGIEMFNFKRNRKVFGGNYSIGLWYYDSSNIEHFKGYRNIMLNISYGYGFSF